MRSRWVDVATIIAAIFVPMVIAAILVDVCRHARSEALRNTAEATQFLLSLVWWLGLLSWCIIRLVIGARQKWPSSGLRMASLVIAILLCPLGCAGFISYMPVNIFCRVLPDQHRIRYELDHQAIAQACATVMARWNHFANKKWDDPELPVALRDVRPKYIAIHEQGITLEMHGGFDHYGLRFQPEEGKRWGLWYYTEGSSTQLATGVTVEEELPTRGSTRTGDPLHGSPPVQP